MSSQNEKNVSDIIRRECKKQTILFQTFVLYHTIYEITWKNIVEPDRSEITI
jgi:hypothetical protein